VNIPILATFFIWAASISLIIALWEHFSRRSAKRKPDTENAETKSTKALVLHVVKDFLVIFAVISLASVALELILSFILWILYICVGFLLMIIGLPLLGFPPGTNGTDHVMKGFFEFYEPFMIIIHFLQQ